MIMHRENFTKEIALMSTIEYPAMVYRNNRNRVFVANCFMKNIIGFGKTEQEAINNLKSTLQNIGMIAIL